MLTPTVTTLPGTVSLNGGAPDADDRGPTTPFGVRLTELMDEHRIRTHRQLAERLRGAQGNFPSLSLVQAVIRGTKKPSRPFVRRIFVSFNIADQEAAEWLTLAGLPESSEDERDERVAQRQAQRLAFYLRPL